MKKTFFSALIDRLYKKNHEDSSGVVWLAVGLVVITYLLLNFRSPLTQLNPVRDALIFNFISDAKASQNFDSQKFWRLRDTLGAVITYNPQYANPQSIFELQNIPDESVQLFEYTAPGLLSREYLMPTFDQSSFSNSTEGEPVYSDGLVSVFTSDTNHTLTILQVYPFEEMEKNNGMMDYQQIKQDLSDSFWVTHTEITVSPEFDFKNL